MYLLANDMIILVYRYSHNHCTCTCTCTRGLFYATLYLLLGHNHFLYCLLGYFGDIIVISSRNLMSNSAIVHHCMLVMPISLFIHYIDKVVTRLSQHCHMHIVVSTWLADRGESYTNEVF